MSFLFGNQLNVTAQINAAGLAKDTSVQAVKTTLGTPAQDSTVSGVTFALGSPAQDSTVAGVSSNVLGVRSDVSALHASGKTVAAEIGVTSLTGTGLVKESGGILSTGIALPAGAAKDASLGTINTTLGTPAQTVDIVTTLPTNLGGGKKLSDINTTLGTPAQTADVITTLPTNIAATGAPLLALSTTPTNGGNPGVQTFTSGQVRSYGQMTMNQVSYEISLSVLASASDTNPYMFMALEWSDSGTGLIIARENWYFGASSSTANLYSGTGRCKGNQLKITLHWLGSLTSGSCQMLVTRTSRIYTRDDFRSIEGFFGIANVTNGTYDPDGGVILSTSPTIGASSTASRAMSLYSGTVRLNATTQTGAGVITILNTGQAGAQSLSSSIVYSANIPSGGSVNGTLNLPRGNCVCQLVNNGASSQSIIAEIIISEQDI